MSVWDKFQAAWFQGVTPRTAGFNTIDIGAHARTDAQLHDGAHVHRGRAGVDERRHQGHHVRRPRVRDVGRDPGPPATSTCSVAVSRAPSIRQAMTVALLGVGIVFATAITLTAISPFPLTETLFESASAFGTVGLSTGITNALPQTGQLLLVIVMLDRPRRPDHVRRRARPAPAQLASTVSPRSGRSSVDRSRHHVRSPDVRQDHPDDAAEHHTTNASKHDGEVVVIGLGRFGSSVAHTLIDMGYEVLGIDVERADRAGARRGVDPRPPGRHDQPQGAEAGRCRRRHDRRRLHRHRHRGERAHGHRPGRSRCQEHLGEGDHERSRPDPPAGRGAPRGVSRRPTWASGSPTS